MTIPENLPENLSDIIETFETLCGLAKDAVGTGNKKGAAAMHHAASLITVKAILKYLQAKEQQSVGRGK